MSTYDLYKTKRVTISLGENTREKMNIIALQIGYKYTSDLYKDIIDNYIKEYEAKAGEIIIDNKKN